MNCILGPQRDGKVQKLSMTEPYPANNTSALCKHLQKYTNTKCC